MCCHSPFFPIHSLFLLSTPTIFHSPLLSFPTSTPTSFSSPSPPSLSLSLFLSLPPFSLPLTLSFPTPTPTSTSFHLPPTLSLSPHYHHSSLPSHFLFPHPTSSHFPPTLSPSPTPIIPSKLPVYFSLWVKWSLYWSQCWVVQSWV